MTKRRTISHLEESGGGNGVEKFPERLKFVVRSSARATTANA